MFAMVKKALSSRKHSSYKSDEEKEKIYDCKDTNLRMSLQESLFLISIIFISFVLHLYVY